MWGQRVCRARVRDGYGDPRLQREHAIASSRGAARWQSQGHGADRGCNGSFGSTAGPVHSTAVSTADATIQLRGDGHLLCRTLIGDLYSCHEGGGECVSLHRSLQLITRGEGTGKQPAMGRKVTVHYAGWLTDGTLFDASYSRGEMATFRLGEVIPGWNEGLCLMKEGAIYKFTIPGDLAYGPRGSPPSIPPNATLVFVVELSKVGE